MFCQARITNPTLKGGWVYTTAKRKEHSRGIVLKQNFYLDQLAVRLGPYPFFLPLIPSPFWILEHYRDSKWSGSVTNHLQPWHPIWRWVGPVRGSWEGTNWVDEGKYLTLEYSFPHWLVCRGRWSYKVVCSQLLGDDWDWNQRGWLILSAMIEVGKSRCQVEKASLSQSFSPLNLTT